MSASTRSVQFVKLHKVLKKYYKPVEPPPERPVLEHLLFACCLENAHYEKAEEALATLVHTFFDWNEIRVTTIKELSEVMAALPDPAAAANRIKRVLQDVFETTYSFELEDLRKKNLGPAIERLQKLGGASKFNIAYLVQSALGGHSIPIDAATANVLKLLNLMTDKEAEEGVVAGLERAIAKNKGVEFGSILHQFAADFQSNPFNTALHKILAQVDPTVETRIPKRRAKAPATPTASAKPPASGVKPKSRAKIVSATESEPPAEPAPSAPLSVETKPKGPVTARAKATKPEPVGLPARTAEPAEAEKQPIKASRKKPEKEPLSPPASLEPAPNSVKPVAADRETDPSVSMKSKDKTKEATKAKETPAAEKLPPTKSPVSRPKLASKSSEPALAEPPSKKTAGTKKPPAQVQKASRDSSSKPPSVSTGLAKKKPR